MKILIAVARGPTGVSYRRVLENRHQSRDPGEPPGAAEVFSMASKAGATIAVFEMRPEELHDLVREACAAGCVVEERTTATLLETLRATVGHGEPPGGARGLTPRERDVLRRLAEGKTSKEMARELHLSVATVETHRRQMTKKLGIRSIAALTKFAVREGLSSLD